MLPLRMRGHRNPQQHRWSDSAVVCLLLLGVLSSGCISTHLVRDKAQAHVEYDQEDEQLKEVNGKPGYYALLPLTVAGDVVTLPFQLGYFIFTSESHSASAQVHGVPIPLP